MNKVLRQLKRIEEAELADDIIEHRQLRVLLAINSNLVTIGEVLAEISEGIQNMASEVVTKVNAKIDAAEETLRGEADEIKAAIEAAGTGGATPEEVTALEGRLDGLNAAIEALVTAPAPPADPPVE